MSEPTNKEVQKNLEDIYKKVNEVKNKLKKDGKKVRDVNIVAVSKIKPSSLIKAIYDHPTIKHKDFGENYVQEIITKSKELPKDIKWHFIGHLQSNKAKQLIDNVENLYIIETVHSKKLAKVINKHYKNKHGESKKLNIFVQINVSKESNKSGTQAGKDVIDLIQFIIKECTNLKLKGLMTIGNYGASINSTFQDQPDFAALRKEKQNIENHFKGVFDGDNELELSMGMSNDFMEAIYFGSTNVRVGSTIFGKRNYSKK